MLPNYTSAFTMAIQLIIRLKYIMLLNLSVILTGNSFSIYVFLKLFRQRRPFTYKIHVNLLLNTKRIIYNCKQLTTLHRQRILCCQQQRISSIEIFDYGLQFKLVKFYCGLNSRTTALILKSYMSNIKISFQLVLLSQ